MIIPQDRFDAAIFVFHISVVTSVLTITQVPYNASIISHERMEVYAYTSIFEVVAKLGICYFLNVGDFDKLKLYAILMFLFRQV